MSKLRQHGARGRAVTVVASCVLVAGCTGISIAPSCPNELQVNESKPLLANEVHPGEIARYFWEVSSPQVAQVLDPTAPTTMLRGINEGEATIQLTASDGLYQVISFCTVRVSGIAEPPDDNANDNTPDNTNANDNAADNTNDNRNPPDRPGGVRKREP